MGSQTAASALTTVLGLLEEGREASLGRGTCPGQAELKGRLCGAGFRTGTAQSKAEILL